MAKKDQIKRTLRLNKKDGTHTDLPIVKATAIRSGAGMLHLDKLQNGSYRLIVSDDIIDDMTQFDNLQMIREDGEKRPREGVCMFGVEESGDA